MKQSKLFFMKQLTQCVCLNCLVWGFFFLIELALFSQEGIITTGGQTEYGNYLSCMLLFHGKISIWSKMGTIASKIIYRGRQGFYFNATDIFKGRRGDIFVGKEQK